MPQTTQKTETDDKIKTALNSILKKWWQLEDQVSNARWKQGKLVHENIEDLTQPEKSALYNRLVRETGQKRETLKKYVWFFKAFPDLPERVKMSGVRASKWMTIAEH